MEMIKQSAKTAMDQTNGSRKVKGQKRHNEQKRLDGSSGYGGAVGWKKKQQNKQKQEERNERKSEEKKMEVQATNDRNKKKNVMKKQKEEDIPTLSLHQSLSSPQHIPLSSFPSFFLLFLLPCTRSVYSPWLFPMPLSAWQR